jgi:hypothetical protein
MLLLRGVVVTYRNENSMPQWHRMNPNSHRYAQLSENYAPTLIVAMLCVPLMTLQRLQDKIAHASS